MIKKIGKSCILLTFFLLLMTALFREREVAAKSGVKSGKVVKIGKTEVALRYNEKKGDFYIIRKGRGKNKVLARFVTSGSVVTDGKFLYYSKKKGSEGKIYKMNLKTGKKKVILSGKGFAVLSGLSDILCIGRMEEDPNLHAKTVFCYQLQTKKTWELDENIMEVHAEDGRILTVTLHFDVSDVPIKLFDTAGKKIFETDAISGFIKKGRIYYVKAGSDEESNVVMVYFSNSLDGDDEKEIGEEEYRRFEP